MGLMNEYFAWKNSSSGHTCDTRLLDIYEVWLEHALRRFEALRTNLDYPTVWKLIKDEKLTD